MTTKTTPSTPASPDAAASTHVDNGRMKTNAGEAHVGLLVMNVPGSRQTPSRYCVDDDKSLYEGAQYRLGRVNLFLAKTLPPDVVNKPVIVYGHRRTGLDKKVRRIGPCPPETTQPVPQMRSDWIADEADWRGHTTKARLAKADYIEAVAVYPLPLIKTKKLAGDQLELTLTNRFDRPLGSSVTFSLYYEGGPKKPMPMFDAQSLDALKPGATKRFVVTAPAAGAQARKPGRGRKLFRGYKLEGTIGEVRLDLLVSLL